MVTRSPGDRPYRVGVAFTLVTLVVALGLALATRGDLSRIAELPFRRLWLLFAGLGLQVLLEVVRIPAARETDLGIGVLLASYALLLGFGLANLRIDAMGVITIGIALNAAVIALNLGMPYRAPEGHAVASTVKHRPERNDDVATVLADRIVIPPLRVSISFGDLIIAVGLVDLCYRGSRRPRGQTRSSAASTLTS